MLLKGIEDGKQINTSKCSRRSTVKRIVYNSALRGETKKKSGKVRKKKESKISVGMILRKCNNLT